MADFTVTDPVTGRTITMTGKKAPTGDQIRAAFANLPPQEAAVAPVPGAAPVEPGSALPAGGDPREAVVTIGSAAIAEPVSGLAGIAGLVAGLVPGGESPLEKGARFQKATQEALTVEPFSQRGAAAVESVGRVAEVGVKGVRAPFAGVAGIAQLPFSGIEGAAATIDRVMSEGIGPTAGAAVLEATGSPALATFVDAVPVGIATIAGVRNPFRRTPAPPPPPRPQFETSPQPGVGRPGLDQPVDITPRAADLPQPAPAAAPAAAPASPLANVAAEGGSDLAALGRQDALGFEIGQNLPDGLTAAQNAEYIAGARAASAEAGISPTNVNRLEEGLRLDAAETPHRSRADIEADLDAVEAQMEIAAKTPADPNAIVNPAEELRANQSALFEELGRSENARIDSRQGALAKVAEGDAELVRQANRQTPDSRKGAPEERAAPDVQQRTRQDVEDLIDELSDESDRLLQGRPKGRDGDLVDDEIRALDNQVDELVEELDLRADIDRIAALPGSVRKAEFIDSLERATFSTSGTDKILDILERRFPDDTAAIRALPEAEKTRLLNGIQFADDFPAIAAEIDNILEGASQARFFKANPPPTPLLAGRDFSQPSTGRGGAAAQPSEASVRAARRIDEINDELDTLTGRRGDVVPDPSDEGQIQRLTRERDELEAFENEITSLRDRGAEDRFVDPASPDFNPAAAAEARIRELEAEGMTRSDAQAVFDAENLSAATPRAAAPRLAASNRLDEARAEFDNLQQRQRRRSTDEGQFRLDALRSEINALDDGLAGRRPMPEPFKSEIDASNQAAIDAQASPLAGVAAGDVSPGATLAGRQPVTRVDAPEAPTAEALAATSSADEVVAAIRGGKPASIAEEVVPDAAIIESAERLGVDLNPEHYSTNAAFQDVARALKSRPGSQLEKAERAALDQVSVQADKMINDIGGSIDKAAVSDSILLETREVIDNLGTQANVAYKAVRESIPDAARVDTTLIKTHLDAVLDGLGGDKSLLTSSERQLLSLIEKGKDGTITYGALDRVRRDVGDGFNKRSGPFADNSDFVLREVYGVLGDTQQGVAEAFGVGTLYSDARALVTKRKGLEDDAVALFGKTAAGSIVPRMRAAGAGLTKGDVTALNKLMEALPAPRRAEVAATILGDLFAGGSRQGGALGTGFAKNWAALNRNITAKNALFRHLPPGAAQRFDDIGRIISGIVKSNQKPLANPSGTAAGIIRALDDATLVTKVLDSTLAGGAAEIIGTSAGAPGLATAVRFGAKKVADGRVAGSAKADALLGSQEFKDAIRVGLEGNTTAANAIIEGSPRFKAWLTTVPPGTAANIARLGFIAWVTSQEEQ